MQSDADIELPPDVDSDDDVPPLCSSSDDEGQRDEVELPPDIDDSDEVLGGGLGKEMLM